MAFSNQLTLKKHGLLILLTLGAFMLSTTNAIYLPVELNSEIESTDDALIRGIPDIDYLESIEQTNAQVVNYCKIYNGNSQCQYCIRDFYLSANSCIAIEYTALIANCNIYSTKTVCLQCDHGFAPSLNGGLCVSVNSAINCAIYATVNTCKTCNAGGYLQNSICLYINNCVQALTTGKCQVCANGFYLDSTASNCFPVTASISNCWSYSSNGKCSACALNFALSTDGLTCLSASQVHNNIDNNCLQNVINDGQTCNLCKPGYNLVLGNCVLKDSAEACFVYDPSNASSCRICAPGFWMSSSSSGCQKNTQITSPSLVDPLSSGIMNAFLALMIGLLMLN